MSHKTRRETMKNLCIKDILQKDITRKINGVVKADSNQEDTIITELSEYVITKEIQEYFQKLFDQYVESFSTPTEDIGIWIAGFFGSGKSHFLKMVGRLLENKKYDGRKASEFFQGKIQNLELLKKLEKASEIPTDVILFNIDNVSDQDTHQNKDSIPLAFLKKFNEYLGFSRDDIKIASFERLLWEQGIFEKFKEKFEVSSGKTWRDGNRNLDFHADDFLDVVEEMGIMTRISAERWLEKENDKSISAESFRDLLEDYLKHKDPKHRIVFLVDEIGQYIGENSQLMLNLQTLVETLGVKFKGRVWVGVTSQQDLGSILTSREHRKNDFSKIQDRFKTKLALSSANIDEVIQKRLLEKKEIEKKNLVDLYEHKRVEIENSIHFDKTGMNIPLYHDAEDFASNYPFVRYQFNMLQDVFAKVRDMGHSGQHMSRGERSLLSSFQEAAIRIKDQNLGLLVPFHYFYESIEQFLEDNVRRPFIHAKLEKGIDEFGLDVLKLLFLIKGLKGVNPNIDNLTSFMVDSIDCDRLALQEKIKKALVALEQQVLIQKDGDNYYFLTNEEQDINRDIKRENVEEKEIYRALDSYIFNDIFQKNSIISEETGNKYAFNRRIDDIESGRSGGPLDITIFTPWSKDYENVVLVGNRSGQELIVRLPYHNKVYLDEIRESLQVESYIKNRQRENARELIVRILESKQRENLHRKQRIKTYIEQAFLNSEVFVRGHKIEIKTKEASKLIEESLRALARTLFHDASLLKTPYDEARIKDVLTTSYDNENTLFDINKDMEANENFKALKKILEQINRQNGRGITITLKDLDEVFTRAPYGWNLFSVHGLVAELFTYKQIQFEESKEVVSDVSEIKNLLTKSQTKILERIVITLKEEIDPELIQKVNNVLKSLFGTSESIAIDDAKESLVAILLENINLQKRYARENSKIYPGIKELQEWIDLVEEITKSTGKTEKVLKNFLDMEEELQEAYNNQDAPLDFFRTTKKDKFDEGLRKIRKIEEYRSGLGKVQETSSYQTLEAILQSKKPYDDIKKIDALLAEIQLEENKLIEEEKEMLLEKINEKKEVFSKLFQERDAVLERSHQKLDNFANRIQTIQDASIFLHMSDFIKLVDSIERDYRNSLKEEVLSIESSAFEVTEDKSNVEKLISDIRSTYKNHRSDLDRFELEKLEEIVERAKKDKEGFLSEANGLAKRKERVRLRKINGLAKSNIETKEEVEDYILRLEKEMQELKSKMFLAIEENKIIDIQ